jgi:ABC-type transporter Mla maintaining outer membrane lipid asymmetry ATPase subunit MlaF
VIERTRHPGGAENAAAVPHNTPLVELENATIVSPPGHGAPVITRIQWRIEAGDYWVVAGLPGSGKTELLAAAAGLTRLAGGTHRLFGCALSDLDSAEQLRLRLRIGLVYGGGARLFQHLTVAQNIALPLCYHRNCHPVAAHEAVLEMLELFELQSVAQSLAGRIGWHLRPRVGLARALILQPEVLLLDDPLAGLDPRQADWMLALLERLSHGRDGTNRSPVTLAVSAGDLRTWRDRARQFALLKQGQWLTLGSQADLAVTREALALELLGTSRPVT